MPISNEELREQIAKRLSSDNPWWLNGSIYDDYKKMLPRLYLEEFYSLVSEMSVRRAVILMGPRRVGKTVMIFHCIKKLLENGIDPRKIIYLSIDTPIYNNVPLEELFELARTILMQANSPEGFYVFFDEIQYLKNWELSLKSLVDTYRQSKFIASGSAAAALKMKSLESGAGRFTDFMLPPLTFFEYINLQGHQNLLPKTDSDICPYYPFDIDRLNCLFIDYINYGGYPEIVLSDVIKLNPGRYIKNDIIDKVLLRDLPSLYGIKDIQELNKFFVYIAYWSGNEFSYQTLTQGSGIKKDTIKKYLEYLEAAFLIKVVHKLDQNGKRLQRVSTFKIYLTNPSLRCALFNPITTDDGQIGNMVETAIFSQWIQGGKTDFYYANWINGRDKGEVDIVWVNESTQKPFSLAEIKWSDRYVNNVSELKSLQYFLACNQDINKVIVTSRTKLCKAVLGKHTVNFIPSAVYAYWIADYLFNKRLQ
ncbi:MAG: ATP-binding protein [Muribaculaceae bacterium]